MIHKESVVVISDDLTAADLGGEAVVLDLNKGAYYGLNEVGAHVLELIKQPIPVNRILEMLQQEYEVDKDLLVKDVLGFLRKMDDLNLIRTLNDTAA